MPPLRYFQGKIKENYYEIKIFVMCWFCGQCCKKRQKRLGFGDLMRGKFKVCEARNVTDLGKITKIAAHLHFVNFFPLI